MLEKLFEARRLGVDLLDYAVHQLHSLVELVKPQKKVIQVFDRDQELVRAEERLQMLLG